MQDPDVGPAPVTSLLPQSLSILLVAGTP